MQAQSLALFGQRTLKAILTGGVVYDVVVGMDPTIYKTHLGPNLCSATY